MTFLFETTAIATQHIKLLIHSLHYLNLCFYLLYFFWQARLLLLQLALPSAIFLLCWVLLLFCGSL
ncbi:hypothetical protein BDQ17DRAFT_406987 [Cyathus striatus]|nr:hypothetical protein BDQ17DRAFT_921720 [Cyathus striatus]KAF9004691.1 hypothetical protein BDQ17DRAFT_406987 [Cyathus striatus]